MSNPEMNVDPNVLIKALQGALNSSNKKIVQLNSVVDIARKVNETNKFKTALLAFAGEIVDRLHAERVSIGWLKHDYIQLKAISHTDRFEKKMQIVQDLEAAMEEAYEQDAAILFPAPENGSALTRSHEQYSTKHNAGNLLSVPIRHNNDIMAVVTCERAKQPFTDIDASEIFLVATLTSARIKELYQKSNWFGARMVRQTRNLLAKGLGFEHTWAKFFGILAASFAVFAAIFPLQYKVNAPAILKTDKVMYLTAPFNGFIDSVSVKPGDIVYKGQELMRLDQKELKLEEANLLAEEQNNRREIQKAQANQMLADMRIHQARLAQTLAKLQTVRYKLSKSVIYATADSAIIIEGDLQKRIGAPVNQGTELFQMALIENIYVEVDVAEEEIKNVKTGVKGFLALKSRPDLTFEFNTDRITPTATVKEQENVFPVRGELLGRAPNWFRPGMTGIAKILAGKKTLWWILSHQALDYLRLKLWW